jgi:transcriptional regulator NrdR family protein
MGKRTNPEKCANPSCASSHQVIIIETRMTACGSRARRRRCEGCGHLWYTVQPPEEQVESWRLIWTKKGPVTLEPPPESPEKGKI